VARVPRLEISLNSLTILDVWRDRLRDWSSLSQRARQRRDALQQPHGGDQRSGQESISRTARPILVTIASSTHCLIDALPSRHVALSTLAASQTFSASSR
jgi:hypothetical protein